MSVITIDFETYYDKDYSLKKMSTEAYIRDPRFEVIGVGVRVDDGEALWYSGTKTEILHFLETFNIHEHYMLAHHTAFDGAILKWHFGIEPKFYLDTLSMARPITGATVGGSLAALAKKFMLGEKGTEVVSALGLRRKDFDSVGLAAYGEYCKNDVVLCSNLYQVLHQWIPNKELYLIDLMLRMFIDPVLELDRAELGQHLLMVQQKKADLMNKIAEQGQGFATSVLMSNPKLAVLLETLGVDPPMKRNKDGELTFAFAKTDEEFKALLDHEDPMVQAVVAARLGVKSTLEETRTKAFIEISKRGPLPIMLNYYGAHTGRASGADGINLQNLPRGGALRRAMKAPPGHVVIAGDSSQIEARIVAWWAGQEDLVEDFRNGVDTYSKFASDIYGRVVTKADTLERFVGKTSTLGLGFGMGPPKFKNTLRIGQGGISVDMPLEKCQEIVALYRHQRAAIAALWKSAQEALRAVVDGHTAVLGVPLPLVWDQEGIHLPNGMLIRYANLRRERNKDTGDTEYKYDSRRGPVYIYGGKVVENVVQALARIIVFDQMCKLRKKLATLDGDIPARVARRMEMGQAHRFVIPLTVHDEIVAVVPEQWQTAVSLTVTDLMKEVPLWAEGLPISCEVKSGLSYGNCK